MFVVLATVGSYHLSLHDALPISDPRVVAGLRIAVGALVALSFLSQLPFVELWWGEGGLVPRRLGRSIVDRQAGSLRSEEHTSELQSLRHLVCRLLLEKKKRNT